MSLFDDFALKTILSRPRTSRRQETVSRRAAILLPTDSPRLIIHSVRNRALSGCYHEEIRARCRSSRATVKKAILKRRLEDRNLRVTRTDTDWRNPGSARERRSALAANGRSVIIAVYRPRRHFCTRRPNAFDLPMIISDYRLRAWRPAGMRRSPGARFSQESGRIWIERSRACVRSSRNRYGSGSANPHHRALRSRTSTWTKGPCAAVVGYLPSPPISPCASGRAAASSISR